MKVTVMNYKIMNSKAKVIKKHPSILSCIMRVRYPVKLTGGLKPTGGITFL